MAIPTRIEQFSCPGCSGSMVFDPESGGMKCPFCGRTEALAASATIAPEHPLDRALAAAPPPQSLSAKALEVSCGDCGSVVAFEPPEIAGACPFCGSTIVAQPKAADPLIAPDALLPAKVPKNAAQAQVREWLASRWFAPNALKKMAQQEGIGGVYLPFWDYASNTASAYTGERGEHYYETEYYTETDNQGREVQRSRQVQHTRWYPAAGQVSHNFDAVLVAATRAVNPARLTALEPWDLPALCSYQPAYLAGFKAQRYQVELRDGFESAKDVMAATIRSDVMRDIGGDEQRVLSVETQYDNVRFRHLLLPVWLGSYRFQGKVYQVMVNARSGEVQGERPYSVAKIALLVIAILTILIVILILRSH